MILKLKLMLTTAFVSSLTAGGELRSASAGGLHGPEVRARLESGPCAAAHSPLAERNGFLQLRLHGYQASFLMSTLRNMAHFLEDDSAPQVLPMEISVRDTHVNLKVRCVLYSGLVIPAFVSPPEVIVAELLNTCKISAGYSSCFFQSCCSNRAHNSLPYGKAAKLTKLNILNRGLIGIWI